jgi:hypothetical protein
MSDFSAIDKEIVARLLTKSDDELFAQLGATVLGDRHGAFPPPFAKLVAQGKAWFANRQVEICNQVCRSRAIRLLTDDNDQAHLILTLTGLLGHVVEPVNAACLAVIICRLGVKRLCQPYWDNDSDEISMPGPSSPT